MTPFLLYLLLLSLLHLLLLHLLLFLLLPFSPRFVAPPKLHGSQKGFRPVPPVPALSREISPDSAPESVRRFEDILIESQKLTTREDGDIEPRARSLARSDLGDRSSRYNDNVNDLLAYVVGSLCHGLFTLASAPLQKASTESLSDDATRRDADGSSNTR